MLVAAICAVALILNVISFASNSMTTNPTAPSAATPGTGQSASDVAARAAARAALQNLKNYATGGVTALAARETGAYSFVRAGGVLVTDNALATPEARAFGFLGQHGALIGMSTTEQSIAAGVPALPGTKASKLQAAKVTTDELGNKHVRLSQSYQGLPVFGAQVVVHMNNQGITAVNGNFVPDVAVTTTPAITAQKAGQIATGLLRKQLGNLAFSVGKTELSVYRTGLLEGFAGQNVLAYSVEVAGGQNVKEQVWLNALTGSLLNRISLVPDALYRVVYTPKYDSANPDLFVVRKEGDAPSLVPVVNDLYDFTGQTYNLYSSAFGRDSFDAAGKTMRTVYLVNDQCPNAYWDGQTTNYCPDITGDDVVSHEWSHAYTQYTHGLIYSYQSGALNESYSDIFGETVDLINGVDGSGGSDNEHRAIYDDSNGVPVQTGGGARWRIGEDVKSLNQPALGILRDMYQPTYYGNPDKVSSPNYSCGADDNGGVHKNSGVPNLAYALLVDGGTFNGQTINGIGLTKAAAIYFRAESVYQIPTTNFANHEQSLRAAAADLVGAQLYELSTSTKNRTPSAQTITQADITELGKVMAAVEMSQPAAQCSFTPVLDPNTPAACDGNTTIFADDFEDGNLDGWTKASAGTFAGWPNFNWTVRGQLPENHAGMAAFAVDPPDGVCGDPNGDYSGKFSMDSPSITVPANVDNLKVSFEHFVETEAAVDGGNVYLSVNGGAFTQIPASRFTFNPYNGALRAAPPTDQNTNPKAGEDAFSGSNIGTGMGSFGTSIVDLSGLASPGQTIKVRFEFGLDGCGGGTGWIVDNFRVYSCPSLAGPTLSLTDYENPDTNGAYTLTWTRPTGTSGPDVVQESASACSPLLADNAESGLTKWNSTTVGLGSFNWETSTAKPAHETTSFWARAAEGATDASSILTTKEAVNIPANGTTLLRFSDWDMNEGDDNVYVEASENGTSWNIVYSHNRSELAPDAAPYFATEPFFDRKVDLSAYRGKSVFLRFRYTVGAEDRAGSTPFGWFVDDISISNDTWNTIGETSGTSLAVTGRPKGQLCYRVRTNYNFGSAPVPSPFSNVVQAITSVSLPTCSLPLQRRLYVSDFDGDGKTDVSTWNQDGTWSIINSSDNSTRSQVWGGAAYGDVAVPGDYDGDRKTDIAVFRNDGNWYIIRSSDGGGYAQAWGNAGDRAVPADYDGDGKTDLAVWRPSNGTFYILQSSGGSLTRAWGINGDKPVPGDYDRDGRADIAIYRSSEGNWYIIGSTKGGYVQNWGGSNDQPAQGDYDGDGLTDVAFYRPSDSTWHITASCALGSNRVKQFGTAGDVAVPGDYDGDGTTDIAVFRPSSGDWLILLSSTGSQLRPNLGNGTSTPTPATYIP
jgi:Zn-dependent metalloprotease